MTDDDWGRAKRAPGKKDTRKWCKGKVGHPHKLVIAVPGNMAGWYLARWGCRWYRTYGRDSEVTPHRWSCVHAELCTECGKILKYSLKAEQCPEYKEFDPNEQQR